jgi:tetrahydromethanopterin S-methyltransferase subunit A
MMASVWRRTYAALERMGVGNMRRLDALHALLWQTIRRPARGQPGNRAWPVTPGTYVLGDPRATVAVCTLTTVTLIRPMAALPGVAIAGVLRTANLGIEKIVRNIIANQYIRLLLVCGQESPLFHPGQSLCALWHNGVGEGNVILGARGYMPALTGLTTEMVAAFRRQVRLLDRIGEMDIAALSTEVRRLAENSHPGDSPTVPPVDTRTTGPADEGFAVLQPGGKREPLAYDPKGFFVITIDQSKACIIAHHYTPDAHPGHVMRGRSSEGMWLALIREGLVTQLSHAAYLGAELVKAETALRLGLTYEQDRPLASS